MIAPTVGRIVWFHQGLHKNRNVADNGDQPLAAMVIYVHNDRQVNLDVVDHKGTHHSYPGVLLLQGDEDYKPVGDYAEWMPFQKGQAAKQEMKTPTTEENAP